MGKGEGLTKFAAVEKSLCLKVVYPLVHEVVGGSGQEQGRMVGHCQLQGELVATGVGQRHLETGDELKDCLGGLWRGRGRQL